MTDTPPEPAADAGAAAAAPLSLQRLRLADPLRWLWRGARDLCALPGIALFYGLCFWCMARLLGAVLRTRPQYAMSLASGCLLLGPFLAMGLYDASRRRAAGQVARLSESITCWQRNLASMGMLVLVLLLLELLWGRVSLVVFALFFDSGMPSTAGLLQALLSPGNWSFVAVYCAVGGAFAALVFAGAVLAFPMILERDADALTAAITSVRVVLANGAVMLLWGALITACVALSLYWLWGLALLVTGPLLGHASWHAYRAALGPLPATAHTPAPDS